MNCVNPGDQRICALKWYMCRKAMRKQEFPTPGLFSSDNSKLLTASHTVVIVLYRLQGILINADHCP